MRSNCPRKANNDGGDRQVFILLTAVFANAKTPPRGRTLASGGLWPCLRRYASSVYEDTSSLLLFGWRKTVVESTLFTGLQNRCPYRQVCPWPCLRRFASEVVYIAHGSFCWRKNASAGAGLRPAAVGLASDASRPRSMRTPLTFDSWAGGRPLRAQRCTPVCKTDAHTGRYRQVLAGIGRYYGSRP